MPRTTELQVVASETYPHGLRVNDVITIGQRANSEPWPAKITKIDRKEKWMILHLEDVSTRFEFTRRLPIDATYKIQREEPTEEETTIERAVWRQRRVEEAIASAPETRDAAIAKLTDDLAKGYGLDSNGGNAAAAIAAANLWAEVDRLRSFVKSADDQPMGIDEAVKIVALGCYRRILSQMSVVNQRTGFHGAVAQTGQWADAKFIEHLGWYGYAADLDVTWL